MRAVLLLITVSFVVVSTADEVAYVVVGASVEGSDQVEQPKWIGVISSHHRVRIYHLSADAIVSPLTPGRYQNVHIDFHENYRISRGAKPIRLAKPFSVAAGAVTIIGMIKLPSDPDFREVEIVVNDELIALACAKNREVMEGHPVFIVGSKEEQPVSIKCPTT